MTKIVSVSIKTYNNWWKNVLMKQILARSPDKGTGGRGYFMTTASRRRLENDFESEDICEESYEKIEESFGSAMRVPTLTYDTLPSREYPVRHCMQLARRPRGSKNRHNCLGLLFYTCSHTSIRADNHHRACPGSEAVRNRRQTDCKTVF